LIYALTRAKKNNLAYWHEQPSEYLMKTYRRLLLLALFALPILSGCNSDDNDNPAPATFGAATFDNATWD
jgi:hypothetical protein